MLLIKHLLLLLVFLANPIAQAQSLDDEAIKWLQEYIKIDTINPPGNEYRAVEFYKKIFQSEGIKFSTAESAPGRGNIWARLNGGDESALILLQHTDVVPADPKYWTTDPLSGDIKTTFLLTIFLVMVYREFPKQYSKTIILYLVSSVSSQFIKKFEQFR